MKICLIFIVLINILNNGCGTQKNLSNETRAKIKAIEVVEMIKKDQIKDLHSHLNFELKPSYSYFKEWFDEILPILDTLTVDTSDFIVTNERLVKSRKYYNYPTYEVRLQFKDSKTTPGEDDQLNIFLTILESEEIIIEHVKVIDSTPIILDVKDLQIPIQIKED